MFRLQGPGVSHQTRLENLCIILADDSSARKLIPLPSNQDLMNALNNSSQSQTPINNDNTQSLDDIQTNELCAVVWHHKNKLNWFIGYVTHKHSSTKISIEHLARVGKNNRLWQYSDPPEELEVDMSQILKVKPTGHWDMTNIRKTKFILDNHFDIQNMFTDM